MFSKAHPATIGAARRGGSPGHTGGSGRVGLLLACAQAACAGNRPSPPPPPSPPASVEVGGADASPITFERMARYPEPGWQIPRQVAFSPDGGRVTYLASEDGGDRMSLFARDVGTGETRVLLRASDAAAPTGLPFSRAEELRRERQRTRIGGVTAYAWARRAPVLLVPLAGDVFLWREGSPLRRLTATPEPEIDPRICPDGERIAFVRGRELFLLDVGSGAETQLTRGAPPGVTRGLADFLAQEEFSETSGHFWSPDCKRLAFLEVDERRVAEVPVVGFRDGGPDVMMQRYPRPGAPNPSVRAGVIDVETGRTTWIEPLDASESYLVRFAFSHDSRWLYHQRIRRDQRRLALVRSDVRTGTSRAVVVEEAPTWVEPCPYHLLERRPGFLWVSPSSGNHHLELYDGAGGRRPLTSGEGNVASIAAVDEERGLAHVLASFDGPLERHLYAVPLADGPLRRITPERGSHSVTFSHDARRFVDVHSALDRLPRAVLRDVEGAVLGELPVPLDPDFATLGIRIPELVSLRGPSGDTLHAALLRPRRMLPGGRHPAVISVYGGPHVQTIRDAWAPRLLWQHLADRGFVVLQLDNRGSAGRSRAFETALHRQVGVVELVDQLAAVEHLRGLPFVDPRRVGVTGVSYGGYLAARMILAAPERIRAAVAIAPVTRWELYDSAYTERYLETPEQNPGGYRAADLTLLADRLRGKLLLVHGMMDENVHYEHTASLIQALMRAERPFDLLVFPGERHGTRDPAAKRFQLRSQVEYLVEHLGRPAP